MSDFAESSFRWEELDQQLLLLKLEDLAERMQKEAANATRQAAFETNKSGNSGRYFARLLELQDQVTDAWGIACRMTRTSRMLCQLSKNIAKTMSDAEASKIASKGGRARAEKLSAAERTRIAKLAVAARERKRK